ncbi:MAG TPA: SLC13 family permease, partial [Gemmata sp.]
MSSYGIVAFVAFYVMLGGLLVFHKRKNLVVGLGFAAATAIFLLRHHERAEFREHSLALLAGLVALLAGIGGLWFQRRSLLHHRPRAYLRLMTAQGALFLAVLILTAASFRGAFGPYLDHLGEPHRFHLLWNLAAILPGFALVSYYFEHSGAAAGIARSWFARTDARVLWCVFFLSVVLDNIAAAMIGATIVASMYGRHPPFKLIVAIVMASNLGGAPSPVGDTTTVMIFMAKVCPVTDLFKGAVAVLPVQFLLTVWASRHSEKRLCEQQILAHAEREVGQADREFHQPHQPHQTVSWRSMWPLLGVVGLLVGNVFLDQPALGLWVGMLAGLAIGRIRLNWRELLKAVPNAVFLVTLVATAELL